MLFELDLIARRTPVGARHGDLRLQVDTAAINGTAMYGDKAKAAALVKTQRINVVVGGNDAQAGAPLLQPLLVITHRRAHSCCAASCSTASTMAVPAPRHCSAACRVRISHCSQSGPGTYVSIPSRRPPAASATNAGWSRGWRSSD